MQIWSAILPPIYRGNDDGHNRSPLHIREFPHGAMPRPDETTATGCEPGSFDHLYPRSGGPGDFQEFPNPHIAPGAAMIAPDFAPVRTTLASYSPTGSIATPMVAGACARTGAKDKARAEPSAGEREGTPSHENGPAQFAPGTTCGSMKAIEKKPTKFVSSKSGLVQYAGQAAVSRSGPLFTRTGVDGTIHRQ